MNILILGKNGQVGYDLQFTLFGLGDVVAVDYPEVDFGNADQLRRLVKEVAPGVIVNAAAYTDVERAEDEPEKAKSINGTAPGVLAEEAKRTGALFMHYSTDYVYDGNASSPYTEDAQTGPLSAYGVSKLEGDRAVESAKGWSRILRTSWVYSTRGKNFVRTIVTAAAEGKPLRIINDQTGTPTWSSWLALATRHVIVQELSSRRDGHQVYHVTGRGHTNWYEFSKEFLAILGFNDEYIRTIEPVASSAYKVKAKRPSYAVLSNAKVEKDYALQVPTWQQQLRISLRGATVASLMYPPAKVK